MPPGRYRLTQKSYIAPEPGKMSVVLEEGAEIVYARKPASHMEPLDEQARINAGLVKVRTAPPPVAASDGAIEIPDDWRALPWPSRKSLASKLTSDPIMSGADAEAAILAEIARRKA